MTLRTRPLTLAVALAAALGAPAFAAGTPSAFDADNTVAGHAAGATAAPVQVQPAPSGYPMSPPPPSWAVPNMSAGPVYGGTAGEVHVLEPNGVTSSVNNPAFDSEDQINGRPAQQPAVIDGRLWGNPAFDSDDTVDGSAVPGSPSQPLLPR